MSGRTPGRPPGRGDSRGRDFPRAGILPETIDGMKSREDARGKPGGTVMAGNSHDRAV